MRIYIYYNITDKPWGGGNSFLKAFRNYIISNRKDIKIVNSINDEYDIFLMNGGHKDQGIYIDLEEVVRYTRPSCLRKFFKKGNAKLIYRLDGIRLRYNKTTSEMDELQFSALKLADHIIFQSKECLMSFREIGYRGQNYSIIYNGVDQDIFNINGRVKRNKDNMIKILSAAWSSNIRKGFEIISLFSEIEGVESFFVGNWCKEVSSRNVKIHTPVKQEDLSKHYNNCDLFLHAAQNDPCPNVVLEALSSGLPVIYHNSGGTPEIASNYGVPLPDLISKESLQETLDKIMGNYDLFFNRIEKNMMNYSMESVAEQYLKVFEKVINEV